MANDRFFSEALAFVTVGVPHRNCVAYKSVSGHLALKDDVNKDCFFLGHNIGAVSENY